VDRRPRPQEGNGQEDAPPAQGRPDQPAGGRRVRAGSMSRMNTMVEKRGALGKTAGDGRLPKAVGRRRSGMPFWQVKTGSPQPEKTP